MLGPVKASVQAFTLRTLAALPILETVLPALEERRQRLHHYYQELTDGQNMGTNRGAVNMTDSFIESPAVFLNKQDWFKIHLRNEASTLRQHASKLWRNPEEYTWWCADVTPLRWAPRRLLATPIWLRLHFSATLNEWESTHMNVMFWSYSSIDVVARISLAWLGSGIINSSLRTFVTSTPTGLGKILKPCVNWATSRFGLTTLTINALWMRAIVEVVTLWDPEKTESAWVGRFLTHLSKGLTAIVQELPTLLADLGLLLAFRNLSIGGRGLAIGRIAYWLVPRIIAWRGTSVDLRASQIGHHNHSPTVWHELQFLNINLNRTLTREGKEIYTKRLVSILQENDEIPIQMEAQRIIDRVTIYRLANLSEESKDNQEILWNRLSKETQYVLEQVTPNEFNQLQLNLGHKIAEYRSTHPALSEALQASAFTNPAHEFTYLRETGGLINQLMALKLLPVMLFSLWTVSAPPFPWGKLEASSQTYEKAWKQIHPSQ